MTLRGLAMAAAALLAITGLTAAHPVSASAYATIEGPPVYSSAPGLPDNRVYEQVSPVDKNGNQAGAGTQENRELPGAGRYGVAATDGSSVLFEGTGPFGETASALVDLFVASKNESASGWSTRALTPRPQQSAAEIGGEVGVPPILVEPSADLSHAVVVPGTYALAPPEEGCASGLFLTGPDPFVAATPLCAGSGVPVGGTPDFSTLYFTSAGALLPEDAARQGGWGFYEYSAAGLREAGVLPDGGLDPFGAVPAASGHGRALQGDQVAAEGRRAFFVSPDPASCEQSGGQNDCSVDPPELYMREDGSRTLLVSRDTLLPEAGGLPAAAPTGVSQMPNPTAEARLGTSVFGSYVFASPDGSQAFFQSGDQLTSDAPTSARGDQAVVSLKSEHEYETPLVTGGTFTLTVTVGGILQTTAPIAYDATAASIRSTLEALTNVGASNVTVGGGPGIPFTVTFGFALEGVTMTMDSSALETSEVSGISVQNQPPPKTYDFDVNTGAMVYLPGVVGQIVATDANGSSLAFVNSTVSPTELDLWSAGPSGGSVTPITQMPGRPEIRVQSGTDLEVPLVTQARMSSDGSAVVFLTSSSLSDAFNSGGVQQLYRYDAAANTLGCVSCPPHGVMPTGNAVISQQQVNEEHYGLGNSYLAVGVRGISADGSRVFFDTPDALVPQDTDSAPPREVEGASVLQGRDVYEWENGVVYLISGGKSADNSYFLDNSESGDDVFFATAEGLVTGDTDGGYDVYDARVPRPGDNPLSAIPCEGSVCQGPPRVPSPLAAPTSSTFSGLGNAAGGEPNLPPPEKATVKTVKCAKGKKLNHGKCVKVKSRNKKTKKGDNDRSSSR